ncbi:MAG: hypothetical protein ACREP9_02880, partial [Candidatus Dormibacteraceae bacterium]
PRVASPRATLGKKVDEFGTLKGFQQRWHACDYPKIGIRGWRLENTKTRTPAVITLFESVSVSERLKNTLSRILPQCMNPNRLSS